MIIVSQDKDKILNFNNITQIYIGYAENNKKRSIRCETLTDTYVTLGIYETEERAREVLGEIIYFYEKNNEDYYYSTNDRRFIDGVEEEYTSGYKKRNTGNTYYMPQE